MPAPTGLTIYMENDTGNFYCECTPPYVGWYVSFDIYIANVGWRGLDGEGIWTTSGMSGYHNGGSYPNNMTIQVRARACSSSVGEGWDGTWSATHATNNPCYMTAPVVEKEPTSYCSSNSATARISFGYGNTTVNAYLYNGTATQMLQGPYPVTAGNPWAYFYNLTPGVTYSIFAIATNGPTGNMLSSTGWYFTTTIPTITDVPTCIADVITMGATYNWYFYCDYGINANYTTEVQEKHTIGSTVLQDWHAYSGDLYMHNMLNGESITYRARYTKTGWVSGSWTVSNTVGKAFDTIIPNPPTNITTSSTTNSITVSFTKAVNASSTTIIFNGVSYNTPNSSYTFSGLNSFTTYSIELYSISSSDDTSTHVTTSAMTKPSQFTRFNYSQGMVMQRLGNNVIVMPYDEWNEFTTKINQWRQFKGYGTYAFTTVYNSSIFSGTIYNQVDAAMDILSKHPGTVVGGVTKIGASLFTNLKTLINSL
jgi:hypothetical protein